MGSPVAVAYVMAPTTSETERHRTTSRGRTSLVGEVDRAADRVVARRVGAEQLAVERGAERGQVGHGLETMSGVTTGLERIEQAQTRSGGLLRVARKGW